MLTLVLVGLVTAAGLGIWFWRSQSVRKVDYTQLLFRELCRAHSLEHADRRLIAKQAARAGIGDPCLLFVDSALWKLDESVAQESSPQGKEMKCLIKLQRTLFLSPKATPNAG